MNQQVIKLKVCEAVSCYCHMSEVKLLLKWACGQEEVVQLGDVSRGFDRHADGQKVTVVNLGHFSK